MTTGATPAQIERAAQSAWEALRPRYPSWEESPEPYRQGWIDDAELRAHCLVPATAIIVDRADLECVLDAWDRHLECVADGEERLFADHSEHERTDEDRYSTRQLLKADRE